jgi:uncharacterized membrane protein YjgN (DUF898 family)
MQGRASGATAPLSWTPAPPAHRPPPGGPPPAVFAGAPGPAALPPVTARRLGFHGSGGTLFGIHVVNALLTLATLGVYYFWGKTRLRRYLFGQTEFEGDRFAYHGTAPELLLGFVRAFVVFAVPILLLTWVRDVLDVDPSLKGLAAFAISILFLVFIPVAMVGARRYRLSRTSWRGIRFSFHGRAGDFIRIFLKGTLLMGLTFGLYYPWFATHRQAFMTSHAGFGSARFGFDGKGRDLFWSYLAAVLLTLPTLGLCWVWFLARRRRFFWDHTVFEGARFRCTATGGALLGLWLVNGLLLVATLGLAWPWVRVRSIRFFLRSLTLAGALDVEQVRQQAQEATATGEGLAGFLDTGFDLG